MDLLNKNHINIILWLPPNNYTFYMYNTLLYTLSNQPSPITSILSAIQSKSFTYYYWLINKASVITELVTSFGGETNDYVNLNIYMVKKIPSDRVTFA